MSRGLGKVERKCLEVLADKSQSKEGLFSTTLLAARVYGVEQITAAQHASIRRALSGLARKGLVIRLGRRQRANAEHWGLASEARPPAQAEGPKPPEPQAPEGG